MPDKCPWELSRNVRGGIRLSRSSVCLATAREEKYGEKVYTETYICKGVNG